MKILIFCPAIAFSGGSGIRGRLLAEGLSSAGADVAVVAPGHPKDWEHRNVRIFSIDKEISWRDALFRAAQAFKPNFIYGVTEAGADAVKAVAKNMFCRSALDLHGLGFVEILELGAGYGPRLPRIISSLNWLSKALSVDLITIANPRLFPLLKCLKRRTIPLFGGTNVSLFTPRGSHQKLGSDPTAIQVLYAGNFHKWQGINLLFEAILSIGAAIQSFEFTFIGSIDKRDEKMKVWKSRLPIGRVHFRDSVEYSKVPEYYRGADVLVVPRPFMLSTYLAFPQKISDYMASGRVVLATDIAPHRWALTQPESGVLCPASAKGLVEGLLACKNPTLRKDLGDKAREIAVEHFCHLKHGEKLLYLFEEQLLENKHV